MRVVSTLVVAAVAGALGAPFPACAEIFKWIDEKGVLHYSNIKPPAGVKVVERFEDAPASTVPPVPRESPATQRERALESRIDQLERDLQEVQRYEAQRYEAQRARAIPIEPYYEPYYPYYPSSVSYFPGYIPSYGFISYGYPIRHVRSPHFRHFPNAPHVPIGVRPPVRPFPVGSAVKSPIGSPIAHQTAPVRAMLR